MHCVIDAALVTGGIIWWHHNSDFIWRHHNGDWWLQKCLLNYALQSSAFIQVFTIYTQVKSLHNKLSLNTLVTHTKAPYKPSKVDELVSSCYIHQSFIKFIHFGTAFGLTEMFLNRYTFPHFWSQTF